MIVRVCLCVPWRNATV